MAAPEGAAEFREETPWKGEGAHGNVPSAPRGKYGPSECCSATEFAPPAPNHPVRRPRRES